MFLFLRIFIAMDRLRGLFGKGPVQPSVRVPVNTDATIADLASSNKLPQRLAALARLSHYLQDGLTLGLPPLLIVHRSS